MTAAAVTTAAGSCVALVAVAAWIRAIVRDPGKPTTPEWSAGELTQLRATLEPRREPCWICSARHCTSCEAPAQAIAANAGYLGHRSEDEVPPSIAPMTLGLPVVARARVLMWSLGRTVVRPGSVVSPRQRMVLLALALRLKQAGVRDGLAASLVYRAGRGELP